MEIRCLGDPVLRRKARVVPKVNRNIKDLLDRMIDAMVEAQGVGLAGPQIGIAKRLIVVDVGDGPIYLVNPEILWTEGICTATEGCLSIPGYVGEVARAEKVRVTGLDREGCQIWIEGDGLLARALQHEIDHLDGILFIDRADRVVEVNEDIEGDGLID